MIIDKDDYIEGYEYYGHTTQKIKGWVDKIRESGDQLTYAIQADDRWHGHRGTIIFSELGEVVKLEHKARPESR